MEFRQLLDQLETFWSHLVWLSVVATVLHVAAAIAISWDALHRKDRPSVAVLWIALVWSMPFVGEFLYVLLGIGRVHRRAMLDREGHRRIGLGSEAGGETCARPTDWPDGMMALAKLIDREGDWDLAPGNQIEPLENGDEAYPSMLAAIDAATDSVWLQTYIFDREGPGEEFADALERAEKRGADVRVIIDDASRFHAKSPVKRLLRREGIARTSFLPKHWWQRILSINLRNHRKILVVDGQIGFTGGMNILPGHRLADKPDHPVPDLHFRVTGPIVQQLLAVFVEDWRFCAGESLKIPSVAAHLASCGGVWACGVPDGPDEDFEKLHTIFAGALACARDEIWLVSPYFLPDESLTSQITLAARRGVAVNIVVPKRNNQFLVKWASEAAYAHFIRAGCRLYETRGDFNHTKLLLVDGLFFSFGSANWDDRSLKLNYEFNVAGFSRELCEDLAGRVRRRVEESGEPVDLDTIRNWSRARVVRNRITRMASPYL